MTDHANDNHIEIYFCPAKDNCKGHRVDQVFTYGNIDREFIDVVVIPMLCGSCVPWEYQIQEIKEV